MLLFFQNQIWLLWLINHCKIFFKVEAAGNVFAITKCRMCKRILSRPAISVDMVVQSIGINLLLSLVASLKQLLLPRFLMNIQQRNNVYVFGEGITTLVFSHGFGCDQSMWRYLVPVFQTHCKIILLDLVGSGKSDLTAYDYDKYETLTGYANDTIEIIERFAEASVIFVGHSVSATIGLLASINSPAQFKAQIMLGPTPCYINDGDYVGGFSRVDIEDLCRTMENNYLGWSNTMAPTIMGSPEKPELALELIDSFSRTDPEIAKHFARAIFFSDYRSALPKCITPTLILQCSDDFLVPCSVGKYMQASMPNARLEIIENIGHCPHLSAPDQTTKAIEDFIFPMR